jgi:imidazolonepropionase
MKEYLVIKNIGRLITLSKSGHGPLGVIEDATCIIHQERIMWIGKSKAAPKIEEDKCESIDAQGGTVMPGLIDAHTHLVHAGTREDEFARRTKGESYEEIARRGGGIMSTVHKTRLASFEELSISAIHRADEAFSKGITTMEVKSGYGLDLETELKMLKVTEWLNKNHPIDFIPTYLAHAVPSEYKNQRLEYIEYIIKKILPEVSKKGLARFCDVFVDEIAFSTEEAREILSAAKSNGLKLKLHADQLSQVGAAELAAEVGAVSADHLEHAAQKGLEMMAEKGVVAVILPSASFFLNRKPPDARRMIDAGLTLATSTDYNPGTAPSLDLFLSATMSSVMCGLEIDEAIKGITLNAAKALGLEKEVGSIEVGKQGDLIILDAPNEYMPIYRYGSNLVRQVIKTGRQVFPR